MFNKEVRESAQKQLERVRVPHVRLTYDVEIGSAIELRELPFEVGILAVFPAMPGHSEHT